MPMRLKASTLPYERAVSPIRTPIRRKLAELIVTLTEQSHPEFITSLRDEGSAWFELPDD